MNDWIDVKDGLPKKEGCYLVLAPGYYGNCHIHGNIAYSTFQPNYKQPWAIERGKKSSAWNNNWKIIAWMKMPKDKMN